MEGRQAGRRTIIIQESDKNPTSSPTQAHLAYVAVAVGTPLVVGVGIGVNPFHTTPPGGTGRNATRLKSAATSVEEKKNNQYTTQPPQNKKRPTLLIHHIPPPIHHNRTPSRELQRKENKHHRNHRPTIQCRAQHIIKLAPPRKVPLPDHILEHRAHGEPRRVVDTHRRRNGGHAVEDNRRADVAHPGFGVTPLPVPEGNREERADDDGVQMGVVDRPGAELACWADETPTKKKIFACQPTEGKRKV